MNRLLAYLYHHLIPLSMAFDYFRSFGSHLSHCQTLWKNYWQLSANRFDAKPEVLRLTAKHESRESPAIADPNSPVIELVDVRAADPSSDESMALRKRARSLATCQQPAVRAASRRRVAYLRETEDFSKFCRTIIYEAAVSNCPSDKHF